MAINKVIYQGYTLLDISDSTVTPETLDKNIVAYAANGERIVGVGGGSGVIEVDELPTAFLANLPDVVLSKDSCLFSSSCTCRLDNDDTFSPDL